MPSVAPVLVVGTTPDYIDWIRRAAPGRAVFLTAPELRSSATEPAPEPDEEILCDLADIAAVRRILRTHLKPRRIELAGVACFDCEWMELAARLAWDFGLPYPSPKSIRLCRDKFRQKRTWREIGLSCPRARLIREPAEALAFFRETGGACVLKPLTGSGSELVFLCSDPGECQENLRRIRAGLHKWQGHPMYRYNCVDGAFAIAEEYIEGTEYSCDFFRQNGRTEILRLTRKHRACGGPFGTTRAYETVAVLPDGLTLDSLENLLCRAADALGISRSICMVDFLLRGREIVLLEMTPRPGGDCLPGLLRASAGLDILTSTLDIAAGRRLSPIPLGDFEPCVGLRIYAAGPGTLRELHTDGLREDPRIHEITILRRPGQAIRVPPDDYTSWLLAQVIFRCDSSSDVQAQCDAIQAKLTVSMESS